jgi:RNA polymerase sigma factor (sigma-70 family)
MALPASRNGLQDQKDQTGNTMKSTTSVTFAAACSASELVSRMRSGDASAWRDLVEQYEPMLPWLARNHRLSAEDVNDAVQLTWLRCLEHIDQLSHPDSLRAWLATICRRESLRLATKGRREMPVNSPSPEQCSLQRSLHGLPPPMGSVNTEKRISVSPEPAAETASELRRERHGGGVTMSPDRIIVARAEALFASDLPMQCHPSEAAVAAAIRNAVKAHGGVRGCAGDVAAAYGDYPETAAARMRWARQVIEAIYSPTAASAPATAISTGQPGTRTGWTDRLETGRQS